jgi:hypothetical protein
MINVSSNFLVVSVTESMSKEIATHVYHEANVSFAKFRSLAQSSRSQQGIELDAFVI